MQSVLTVPQLLLRRSQDQALLYIPSSEEGVEKDDTTALDTARDKQSHTYIRPASLQNPCRPDDTSRYLVRWQSRKRILLSQSPFHWRVWAGKISITDSSQHEI